MTRSGAFSDTITTGDKISGAVNYGCARRFPFYSLYFFWTYTPSASDGRRLSIARLLGIFWRGYRTRRKSNGSTKTRDPRGISYEVQGPKFFLAQKVRDEENDITKYVFVEQYQDQPLQLGEGQAMGWFSPDETHELKMIDHDRFVVEQVRDYLNRLRHER